MSDRSAEGREHPAYLKAIAYVIEEQGISVAGVQRKFKLSYAEASKIVEAMAQDKVCSEPSEKGARVVIPGSLNEWNPAAKRGLALENLGALMQNPKTTIKDLASAAYDAGISISLTIDDESPAPA